VGSIERSVKTAVPCPGAPNAAAALGWALRDRSEAESLDGAETSPRMSFVMAPEPADRRMWIRSEAQGCDARRAECQTVVNTVTGRLFDVLPT
jgi:hypothetical protein